MKNIRTICIISSLFLLISSLSFAESTREIQRLKSAVVKIHTTSAAPDYFTPWRLLNPKQGSGSGSVISGNRILTNAHVVADARYIQVQKNADPKKYLAKLKFVSHEADLAVLEVVDTDFFNGLKALPIGNLPEPLQEVSVYGYPYGGSALSITRGILSRVEHHYYSHGSSYLLAGQIDAAINPGNSGGPVIVNNQIAGVVMQGIPGGENLGYFVPPSVIKHVLKDAEDGSHEGMPDLGFRTQDLESPAMKDSLKIDADQGGILITKIFEESPAFGKLETNDVLLAIDGYKIANDKSIEVRKDLRTNYKYAIDQYHVGDEVELTIAREGEIQKVNLIAGKRLASYNLVINEEFDQLPKYYVYGGIVFVPLNMNLIKRWGRDWRNKAPTEFLYARNRWTSPEKREIVVALKVLPTDVNLGYHKWSNWIVSSVNGKDVRDFSQFTDFVRNAEGQYITFGDEDGFRMVIDNEQAKSSEAQTLELYQIPSPYSLGLFD
ncbi:MAG: trypsin-like peptidase domain-containing protein [Cellvibrionaceae bacterium]